MERLLRQYAHRVSPRAAYAIALASAAVLALFRLGLLELQILEEFPYLLFIVPVAVGAWLGGWGPGLAAMLAGVVLIQVLLIPRRVWLSEPALTGMGAFVLESLVICAIGAARMRIIGALAESARILEDRVEQRTHQLREANESLEREAVEREKASDALRELATKLEASNRELQDFASVASHDLQEPLRKIRAFGDRLQARYTDKLGPDGVDYIRRMQNAAGRMQTLINDLLTLSRVASKAQPFTEVDLKEVAAEVISDLESRIGETGARVCIGDLPRIEADATQMRQLLQNLIGNALKFHRPQATPEVTLSGVVEQDPGGTDENGHIARISIADNGIGFDEKYLDRIFTVFQRLHGRGEYEGTGIGLAVCRRIVERHGGAITASSTPGEGSTFTVRLPVHQMQGKES